MTVITLIAILVMMIKNHFDDNDFSDDDRFFTNSISDSDRSRHTADGEENDRGNFDLNLNLMHLTSLLKMKIADRGNFNPFGDNHADLVFKNNDMTNTKTRNDR